MVAGSRSEKKDLELAGDQANPGTVGAVLEADTGQARRRHAESMTFSSSNASAYAKRFPPTEHKVVTA